MALIIYDDFEDEVVGTSLADIGYTLSGPGSVTVQLDPVYPCIHGNVARQLAPNGVGNSEYCTRNFTDLTAGPVTVAVWMNAYKILSGGLHAHYSINVVNSVPAEIALVSFDCDGKLYYGNAATEYNVAINPFTEEDWYHIRMVFDLAAQTYDLYISSLAALLFSATGISWMDTGAGDVSNIRIDLSGGNWGPGINSLGYFDDLAVSGMDAETESIPTRITLATAFEGDA